MKFFTQPKRCDDVTTLSDKDLICYCVEVNKKRIVDAIRNGATTLQAIKETTGACTGNECKRLNPNGRCCSKEIKALIQWEARNDSSQNFHPMAAKEPLPQSRANGLGDCPNHRMKPTVSQNARSEAEDV